MKRNVRSVLILSLACAALAALPNLAQAQKIDIAFGLSTIDAPGASAAGSNGNHFPQSLTGGAYPGFSGDVLFWHNLGFGAEVFWRGAQSGNFQESGLNFRPVFYNFNAVYSAKLAPHIAAELDGGIGALDTHILGCNPITQNLCTGSVLYGTSTHFDADFGGGLKLYVAKGFFIRPEARFYIINNNADYSSNHASRIGASIGYTFK